MFSLLLFDLHIRVALLLFLLLLFARWRLVVIYFHHFEFLVFLLHFLCFVIFAKFALFLKYCALRNLIANTFFFAGSSSDTPFPAGASSTAAWSASFLARFNAFFFFFNTLCWVSLASVIASFITSRFLRGTSPVSKYFKRSSTCSRKCKPNVSTGTSEKQSIRDANVHLFAKKRLMRPLFFADARPMNVEWKRRPYFGVLAKKNNLF